MPKWIIYVEGEAVEVFEGSKDEAEARADECWHEQCSPECSVEPYNKQEAVEAGLEDEDDE